MEVGDYRHRSLKFHIWKPRTLSPRVRTLAWRLLIRQALVLEARASTYSIHIYVEKNCTRYDQEKIDSHLFFLLWFCKCCLVCYVSSLRSNLLTTYQQKGARFCILHISPSHFRWTVSNTTHYFVFIWKARNEQRFKQERRGLYGRCTTQVQLKHKVQKTYSFCR